MSGQTIEDVWASYGAGGLSSGQATVEVEIGGHQIEASDVEALLDSGRQAVDRPGQVVLHANPAMYTIDDVQGVRSPIGMHASSLGVDIHVIAADEAPLRNVDLTIRQAHLGVRAIVASPVAAALACLSSEERDLGVALVELGAEVTNVSLHAGGMLHRRHGHRRGLASEPQPPLHVFHLFALRVADACTQQPEFFVGRPLVDHCGHFNRLRMVHDHPLHELNVLRRKRRQFRPGRRRQYL
jgi:hypothetical protein